MQYQLGMRQVRCISSVFCFYAGMAELGDALVLETSGLGRAGSIPASRTICTYDETGKHTALKTPGAKVLVGSSPTRCTIFHIPFGYKGRAALYATAVYMGQRQRW